MLQRAQETMQYAVGFDLPADAPPPRRLQLETAIRLLQSRCISFEHFHLYLPSIYNRLEQFYDNIHQLADTAPGTTSFDPSVDGLTHPVPLLPSIPPAG
jgi:hypothetical protein